MKRLSNDFSLMAMMIAILLPLQLSAAHKYGFAEGNFFYNVTDKAGLTVEVTYGSDYGQYFGAIEIPTRVFHDGVAYTVTKVGSYAFAGCSGVTSVSFPETVTTIGDHAFAGCNAMLSMTIPKTILSIGNYAFESCSSFKEFEMEYGPDVLSFGKGASRGLDYSLFSDCPLESVIVRRPLNFKDGYSPFNNNTKLKNATIKNLTGVHRYLFNGCTALTNVSLSDAVITINDYAFAGCRSLHEITIPESVTTISNSAFRDCNNLRSFTVSSGIQTIGDYAFADCVSLTEFTIPSNVISIGNYAFSGCTDLKTLKFEVGAENLKIGKGSSKGAGYCLFYDCPLEKIELRRFLEYSSKKADGYSPFANHPTLKEVTIDNIVRTGNYLFYDCSALTSVSMSNSLVTINEYAFGSCNALKSIKIPTSVKKMETGAFYNCNYLNSFDMGSTEAGSGIEEIGDYCFSNCISLPGLIFPPTLKKIGNYAFSKCTAFTNFAIEESTETLSLGNGSSEGEKTGLFRDCPLTTVFIGRNLSYSYSPLKNITTLTEAKIGNPVTRIPNYIFQGDTELVTLHFNQSCILSSIGKYAFSGCSKLPPHTFPETLTTIDEGAFQNCIGFESFTIGNNVETIGAYAFAGCSNLTGLIFHPALKSIGNYAFKGCIAFNNFAIEEGEETLWLGMGASEGEKYPLFKDCPLTSVFIGRNIDYDYRPLAYNTTLTEVLIGNPVTRIPNYIFQGDTELSSVVFNQNCKLQSVGKYAFDGCTKLLSLELPETVKTYEEGAFRGCIGFTSFIVPATVTNIGNYVFNNCTALTDLVIEDGGETLTLGYGSDSGANDKTGKGLFYDCPLTSVYVGRPLDYSASAKQRYGNSPFAFITSLKNFQIGERVVTLNSQYVRGCIGIETLFIPDNVTGIELSAVYGCNGLKNITLSQNLKTIGNFVFYGCSSLTKVAIPATVNSIGNYAFGSCSALTNLAIEDGSETLTLGYGNDSGDDNTAGKGLFEDCPLESVYLGRPLSYSAKWRQGSSPFARLSTIRDFKMGENVTSIGSQFLRGCSGIESLVIPDKVSSIGRSAFIDCSGLKSITLSAKLNTIGDYVFSGCTSLPKIIIPASVTSIDNYAFRGCTALNNLVIEDGGETLTLGYGTSQGEAYGLFRDCPLKSLYLGRTLSYTGKKDYGYSPFAYVGTLSEVTIGPKVKSLGYCIFYSTAISELYLPSSVRTIHSSSFNRCNNLKTLVILGVTPPTLDDANTFLSNSAEDSKIYVFFPDNYKSTKIWKDYTDKIEAVGEIYSNFTYSGEGHVIGYKTDFPIVLDNRDTEAKDAGIYQKRIDVTYTTNGYNIKDVLDYEYTIKKAPLTITAESCSRNYGEENPEFRFIYDGFVNDEDEKILTKEPTATTKATVDSPAGEYDIVVSGAEAKNYDISYINGVLTIVSIIKGDVNSDGEVNAQDIVDLTNYIAGYNINLIKEKADVNGDGVVNSADVIMVSKTILSK